MALENIDSEIEHLADRYVTEANLNSETLHTNLGPVSAKSFVLGFTKFMEAWDCHGRNLSK